MRKKLKVFEGLPEAKKLRALSYYRLKNDLEKLEIDGKIFIKKRARTVPFGYKDSQDHPGYWEPIELEVKALKKAIEFINDGVSYADAAKWLHQVTGRYISGPGLFKVSKREY